VIPRAGTAPGESHFGTILGVSTQIAVRLPDELVAYVDEAVAAGRARSRADLVARLLARDARRHRAEQDLKRLARRGALADPEALAVALATAATPLED
jgi:Arc/MetJ-type ribon-helix-helix transcriptional regulator